jgi:hypothetical protein
MFLSIWLLGSFLINSLSILLLVLFDKTVLSIGLLIFDIFSVSIVSISIVSISANSIGAICVGAVSISWSISINRISSIGWGARAAGVGGSRECRFGGEESICSVLKNKA